MHRFSETGSTPQGASHMTHPAPGAPNAFVYVKIPVSTTADPLHQREYTIDQTLREMGLGAVIGWGDSLGPTQPDGTRPAAYLRIDINVSELGEARTALRDCLSTLDAPIGTEIHYTVDGVNLEDIHMRSGWMLEQPVPK